MLFSKRYVRSWARHAASVAISTLVLGSLAGCRLQATNQEKLDALQAGLEYGEDGIIYPTASPSPEVEAPVIETLNRDSLDLSEWPSTLSLSGTGSSSDPILVPMRESMTMRFLKIKSAYSNRALSCSLGSNANQAVKSIDLSSRLIEMVHAYFFTDAQRDREWSCHLTENGTTVSNSLHFKSTLQESEIYRASEVSPDTGMFLETSTSISGNGRYIAFISYEDGLVPGDTNGVGDAFFMDLQGPGTLERISVAADGTQGNDTTKSVGGISNDGRYVLFESKATNLASGANNGKYHALVKDRQTGNVILASADGSGTQGTHDSIVYAISANGRYVLFAGSSTNLVAGDTNGQADVFLRDLTGSTTERINVATDGTQTSAFSGNPSMSPDARFVVFQSGSANLVLGDNNAAQDVFLRDRQAGTTEIVSVASDESLSNNTSHIPRVSSDGRFVSFASSATNLDASDTDAYQDIFLRDRQLGTTIRVSGPVLSSANDGTTSLNGMTSDGECIYFNSFSSQFVPGDTNGMKDSFIWFRSTGAVERINVSSSGAQAYGSTGGNGTGISDDCKKIFFGSDTRNWAPYTMSGRKIFLRDRNSASTRFLAVSSRIVEHGVASLAPSIGQDGREILFYTNSSSHMNGGFHSGQHVYVKDRNTGKLDWISTPVLWSVDAVGTNNIDPRMSPDGRFVVFRSDMRNLVAGDTNNVYDVFVRDRTLKTTTRVSIATDGTQSNGTAEKSAISADGRRVLFVSNATNMVLGDNNAKKDVFLRDLGTNTTSLVSIANNNTTLSTQDSDYPAISADGKFAVFHNSSGSLVAGDTNAKLDVFLRDLDNSTTTLISQSSAGTLGNNDSGYPAISATGRYVAFRSNATNLTATATNGKYQVYLRDTQNNTTEIVSINASNAAGDADSTIPSISADGRFVAFESLATNLVTGDTNGQKDCFVRDRQLNVTHRISLGRSGVEGDGTSQACEISADGKYVSFRSSAKNLMGAEDTNAVDDIFVRRVP